MTSDGLGKSLDDPWMTNLTAMYMSKVGKSDVWSQAPTLKMTKSKLTKENIN